MAKNTAKTNVPADDAEIAAANTSDETQNQAIAFVVDHNDGERGEKDEKKKKKKKRSKDREKRRRDDTDEENDGEKSHRERKSNRDGDDDDDRHKVEKEIAIDDASNDKIRKEKRREEDESGERDRDRRMTRDRERERDRGDDRRRDRDRERSRSGERYRRDRYRDRSMSYDSRRRDRDRDRDRDRGGERYRVRDRSASREADRRRRRSRDRSNSPPPRRDRDREASDRDREKAADSDKPKPLSLKDIIAVNPGISIAEAAQRLNAHNLALAQGLIPPPVSAAAAAPVGIAGGAGSFMPGGAGGVVLPAAVSAMPTLSLGAIGAGIGGVIGEGGALTKPHRELYVGNLPPGVTVAQLAEFLNNAMKQFGLSTNPGGSVVTAWVSTDGHYAFVEFRSIDETLAALSYLNGLQVGAHTLKIGRPKGYNGSGSAVAVPMSVAAPPGLGLGGMGLSGLSGLGVPGVASGMGAMNPLMGLAGVGGLAGMPSVTGAAAADVATSNYVMVTNFPGVITDTQARELLGTFGELNAFNLIKTAGGASQSAVVEYQDASATEVALLALPKIDIAGNRLLAQRVPASTAVVLLQPTSVPSVAVPPSVPPPQPPSDAPPTAVIRLSNMTTEEDLTDDEMYLELIEDVRDECSRHGRVLNVIVPRGTQHGDSEANAPATGQIFVQFDSSQSAAAARVAVNGRSFNGKIVAAVFFPEDLFVQKALVIPPGYVSQTQAQSIEGSAPDLD